MNPWIGSIKKILFIFLINIFCLLTVLAAERATLKSLDFNFAAPQSQLEIRFDQDALFEKTVSEADKQVIVDVKNAIIPKKLARKTDTSQFKSNVSLISAYQKGNDVRIVLQLKESGDVSIVQQGDRIVASISNEAGAQATSGESNPSTAMTADSIKTPQAPVGEEQLSSEETSKNDTQTEKLPQATTVIQPPAIAVIDNDTLESFMETQNTKKYVGSKISIQMIGADLQDIFRVIANASEFNILMSDDVKGKMSLDLTDVPWDQVLDIVLKTNKLAAERVANILRIVPAEALQKEKEIEASAKAAAEAAEPLVSKIFPISYGDIAEIKRILDSYLSRDPRNLTIVRGSLDIDKRSNSLVVRETPSNIEKFKRIIKELDTQTPQILIEGKFLEVSESSSRAIEGQIFATSRMDKNGAFDYHPFNNNYAMAFGGKGFAGALPGSRTSALSVSSVAGAAFGFAPKAGIIPGIPNLGALLSITEEASEAKVIASPRVVTQNRQSATITQGQTLMFPTAPGANSSGGFQTVTATLTLNVEPQVTNEGSINLKVSFSQNSPSAQPLAGASLTTDTRQVTTNVLVDSGSTLVIGGVYSSFTNVSEQGIPFLRNIPILGVLFGGKTNIQRKTELFIFMTPRILNEKEAGLKT